MVHHAAACCLRGRVLGLALGVGFITVALSSTLAACETEADPDSADPSPATDGATDTSQSGGDAPDSTAGDLPEPDGAADGSADTAQPDGAGDDGRAQDGTTEPWLVTLRTYGIAPGVLPPRANADWVAFQDGSHDAPWSELTGTDGVYTFAVTDPAGRFGVAVGCADNHALRLIHGSALEATDLHVLACQTGAQPPASHRVEGELAPAGCAHIALGINNLFQTCANPNNSYALNTVPTGTYDLLATTLEPPHRGYISRAFSVAGDVSWGIDLEDPNLSAAASAQDITLPDGWFTALHFFTASTRFDVADMVFAGQGPQYAGFPVALLEADDRYRWCAFGPHPDDTFTAWRECRFFLEPIDLAVGTAIVPPAPTTSAVSAASISWDPLPDVVGFKLTATATAAAPVTTTVAIVSSAWLEGKTSYTLPDPGAVPGWSDDFRVTAPLTWNLEAYHSRDAPTNMLDIQNALAVAGEASDGLHFVVTAVVASLP